MDIMEHLNFNPTNQRWENGKIYNGSSSKTWYTSAEIQKDQKNFRALFLEIYLDWKNILF
jgi:hypothetical protein